MTDAAGNPLATKTWSFTTGPVPTVTASSPASNATGVARNANVTATFSEAIVGYGTTSATIVRTSTGAAVAAVVSYNATTRVLTINPSASLTASTKYTVTLTGSTTTIRDAARNPLTTRTWTFTTGTAL